MESAVYLNWIRLLMNPMWFVLVEDYKILISVMIVNIQYYCQEREKYQISSLSIATEILLMEVVGSL